MNMDIIPEKYQEDIKKANILLKNEGCKTVFLFGSLVTGKIHANSDIDIGIMGLPPEKFFKVYSKLYMDMENEKRKIIFKNEYKETLSEYLSFRHYFRHSYSHEIDWNRLNPLQQEQGHDSLKGVSFLVNRALLSFS